MFRFKMRCLILLVLITSANSVLADVRIFFTKMSITDCNEIGVCDWKLSCSLGNQQESEFFSFVEANSNDSIPINRALTQKEFPPVTVNCSAKEHDGGIGAEWEDVGTGSVEVRTTGSHLIRLNQHSDEGDVTVHFSAEATGTTGQPLTSPPKIGVPFQLGGPKVAANKQDKFVLPVGNRIFVITDGGEVFVHSVGERNIGIPFQLQGPKVAANPQDKRVLAIANKLLVITQDGSVFGHSLSEKGIGAPFQLGGPKVAARSEDKWVLPLRDHILVITQDGRVFAHNAFDKNIGIPFQLDGPRVAARPEDKFVVTMSDRILVITQDGRVFAHDIIGVQDGLFFTPKTIRPAFQIEGSKVAANPQDKLVFSVGNRILVITQDGGEPPRISRRPVVVSHAALADSISC